MKTLATLCTIVGLSTASLIPRDSDAMHFGDSGKEIHNTRDFEGVIRIERGLTLWAVASNYYRADTHQHIAANVRNIARYNHIKDPNKIRVGQTIKLPGYELYDSKLDE